jgi:hypothetical protein
MKLEQSCFTIDTIARFLAFGINVRKPAYPTSWNIFEVFAMFIQQVVVVLKIIHPGDHI